MQIKIKNSFTKIFILGIIILSGVTTVKAENNLDFAVLAPPASTLLGRPSDKAYGPGAQIAVYLSKQDQNALEQHYQSLLKGQGFTYRLDKEIRERFARRLRFDKDDLVVDISLIGRGEEGTQVMIAQYLGSAQALDVKDVISFEGPLVSLPEVPGQDKDLTVSPAAIPSADSRALAKTLDFEVPAPLESKSLDKSPLSGLFIGNTKVATYQSNLAPKAVELYYQTFFKRQGFTYRKDKESRILSFRRLQFQRQDLVVDIFLGNRDTGSLVVIAEYLASEGGLAAEKDTFASANLPQTDAPGVDLVGIPRPPQAVRWTSTKQPNETTVAYATPLSVAELRDFYLETMPSQGWEMVTDMATQEALQTYERTTGKKALPSQQMPVSGIGDLNQIIRNSHVLDFKNDTGTARVIIHPNFVDPKSGSLVQIIYTYKEGD